MQNDKYRDFIVIFADYMGTIMKLIAKMFTIAGMAAALVSCTDKAAENKDFKFLIGNVHVKNGVMFRHRKVFQKHLVVFPFEVLP